VLDLIFRAIMGESLTDLFVVFAVGFGVFAKNLCCVACVNV